MEAAAMNGSMIDIKTDAGSGYTGYLSKPEKAKGPGILLIQEIFGVNSHIKEVADLYAAAGYVVLAPDVFWRVEPGVQLGYTPEDVQKGAALAGKCKPEEIVQDLHKAAETLKAQPQFGGKLGAVGYCMGGTYAYLLATGDVVDVAVGYYGGNIDKYLDAAKNLHCPIMLHFGEKDTHISQSKVDTIAAALKGKGHVEIFVYKNADHGFNCDQRKSYDRQSAMLAFGRSMVLLDRTLT
jgi:carboxymethylenebutenolidase